MYKLGGVSLKNYKMLFWVTIFINSFLLFLVEPMINRMLLPIAGSSMQVWNIALMCFQVILLGGYVYVHYLPKLVGYKNYLKVHIALLVLSTIITFIFFKKPEFIVNPVNPTLDIIFILLITIGVPFFVLSTSSTNFQKWYNLTYDESPYYLYAVSNTGNVVALIGYIIVIEVLLGLNNQIILFNSLYAIAAVFSIYAALYIHKGYNDNIYEELAQQVDITEKNKLVEKENYIGFCYHSFLMH